MRLFILFIVCVLNATLVAANPVVVETRLLRVEGNSLIIETDYGSTDIQRDTIKAVRIHKGKSELKLLNNVVIILSNQTGQVDTKWRELPAAKSKPKPRRTIPSAKKKTTNVSASKMQAYVRELTGLVSEARPGIESTREAGDVRNVEFLIRDLTKGKSEPSRESPSVDRVRSLASIAPQRVAARNRVIDARNQQLQGIQIEIRMLSQERQANQPHPTDGKYELLRKQKRRSQIDREIERLKQQERNLRKVAQEEALQHKVLQERSQL